MAKWTEEELEEAKADILISLLKIRKVGENHTSEDNICKGFPTRDHKKIKKARKLLKKDEFIICKPTSYGKQCSINSEKMEEIISMPKIKKASKNDALLLKRIKEFGYANLILK